MGSLVRVAAATPARLAPAPVPAGPAALPFEVVESKLHAPTLRPGTVSRTALVNRLKAARENTVATVTAPAGYGKTILLAQWAARDGRPSQTPKSSPPKALP